MTRTAPTVSPLLQLDITVNPVDSGFEYIPGAGAGAIPWYSYSASLPSVTLGAGTYRVSVVENDASTDLIGNTRWLWADSDTAGVRATRLNDSQAWNAFTDINHAFSLTGKVIPVPAAVWLSGSGLIALASIARRKTA